MPAFQPRESNILDVIRDYEQRLQALETGARIGSTSIGASGRLVVLNQNNSQVLRIGSLSTGATAYGIERLGPGGWIADTFPDNAWQVPMYQNSWAPYNSGGFANVQYRKTSQGVVIIEGLAKGPSATSNNVVIFQLPTGYRPSSTLAFPSIGNDAFARVDVRPDGTVVAETGNTAWITFSGIVFYADQ